MSHRKSETAAWREVQDAAAELRGSRFEHVVRIGKQLDQLARSMRAQLIEGVHENPALMIVGNPKGGSEWSNRVLEIRYVHRKDRKQYTHPFDPGVSLRANRDGSVTIYRPDGLPVWDDF